MNLQERLKLHQDWLSNKNHGIRFNAAQFDIQGINLEEVNLKWANLKGVNFEEVNLQRANLQGVNLQGANLQGAHLRFANLQGANLQDANLQEAHLQFAYLQGVNLEGVSLEGAELNNAIGNKREIKSGQIEEYNFVYTATHLFIGCQCKPIEEWWDWNPGEYAEPWARLSPVLRQLIEASPALPTKLERTK